MTHLTTQELHKSAISTINFPTTICPGVPGPSDCTAAAPLHVFFLPLDVTGRLERAFVTARLFFLLLFVSSHSTPGEQRDRRISRRNASRTRRTRRSTAAHQTSWPTLFGRRREKRNSAGRFRCDWLSSFARTRQSVTIPLARPSCMHAGAFGEGGTVCFSCALPHAACTCQGLA